MVKLKIELPDNFFEEEVKCDYTITKEMKEVWAVELDLLTEFDRVCKEIGVKYFLEGGTLLGAVRHKGFIPWDDDIDVSMLRDDYDRLLENAPAKFKHPYFFQCAYTDYGYYRGHAQLRNSETTGMLPYEKEKVKFNQGIFIDIFVLDGIPEKEYQFRSMIRQMNFYRFIFACIFFPYSDRKWREKLKSIIGWILLKFHFNHLKLYKKYEKVMKQYNGNQIVDYVCMRRKKNWHRRLKKSWYEDVAFLEFEGREFPVPKGWKDFMIAYFGKDYMIPQKSNSDHQSKGSLIFDTNKSYKEYV